MTSYTGIYSSYNYEANNRRKQEKTTGKKAKEAKWPVGNWKRLRAKKQKKQNDP